MEYDKRGLEVTASSSKAVKSLDRAITGYLSISRDTMALIDNTITIDSNFLMAHCLKGYLLNLSNKPELNDQVLRSLDNAQKSMEIHGATDRERSHVSALEELYKGNQLRAISYWEQLLINYPLDIVALKIVHLHYFRLGDMPNLRDTSARVAHAWNDSIPGYGHFLGIRSFGLMETGDYRAAEKIGSQAVELVQHDLYAIHAVTHIHEMEGRWRDGLTWLDNPSFNWEYWNNFRFHVWWHYGLFLIELEQYDAALMLYDTRVRGEKSNAPTDTASAISTLWRLEVVGVDVGQRWEELADIAEQRFKDHLFAYFDCHTMVALTAGKREETALRMLVSLEDIELNNTVTQSLILTEIGIPLCKAIYAYHKADYGLVVDLMMPIRNELYRLGGSHVQRDLFVQILLHAALNSGRFALAQALLAERVALKPNSGSSWRHYARALEGGGKKTHAKEAHSRATAALAV